MLPKKPKGSMLIARVGIARTFKRIPVPQERGRFTQPTLLPRISHLRCPAERNVIVRIKKVEPCDDIIPVRSNLLYRFVEEFAALVIRRSATVLIFGPRRDFPIAPGRMFTNPGQNLGIGFSLLQQSENIFGSQAGKRQKALIKRTSVVVL